MIADYTFISLNLFLSIIHLCRKKMQIAEKNCSIDIKKYVYFFINNDIILILLFRNNLNNN